MSEAEKPRKVRIGDLKGGISVLVIGIIVIASCLGFYFSIPLATRVGSGSFAGIILTHYLPIGIVIFIIGIGYTSWKSSRVKRKS